MKTLVLGLTGPLATGKGTVAKYLQTKYQASIYGFSTPLRNILDRVYQEQTRKNMQDLSLDLRNRFGDDILALTIAKDVEKDASQVIIVDGVRRLPDIKYLRELPNFYLISIETKQETRWQRMTQRKQNPDDATKTFEQFQKDEQAEAEQQIATVAKTADFIIDNNGDYSDTEKLIEDILKKINENKS